MFIDASDVSTSQGGLEVETILYIGIVVGGVIGVVLTISIIIFIVRKKILKGSVKKLPFFLMIIIYRVMLLLLIHLHYILNDFIFQQLGIKTNVLVSKMMTTITIAQNQWVHERLHNPHRQLV